MALNNIAEEDHGIPVKQDEDIVIIEENKQYNYVNDSILSQIPMNKDEEKRGSSGMGQMPTGPDFSSG